MTTLLDGVGGAHCTPLKSILKHGQNVSTSVLASPLYGTTSGLASSGHNELLTTTTSTAAAADHPSSSLAIFEGSTVHYIPASGIAGTATSTTTTIDGTEYIDGGNFITFLPPPPAALPSLANHQPNQHQQQLPTSEEQQTLQSVTSSIPQ